MTSKLNQKEMQRIIKKLFEGRADLIDRDVRDCIKRGENYYVVYNNKTMTLSPDDLKTKCLGRQYINNKNTGHKYELFSYKFVPDKPVKDEQQTS
jgi:hypothetical protein